MSNYAKVIVSKKSFQLCIPLLVTFLAVSAAAQTGSLHGSSAETQAVTEMRARLSAALAKGDIAACKREGDNLARYQQASAGEALIDADAAAVDRRLREVSAVFDQFRQVQELNSKKAVQQAYGLIRAIAVKMAEDAVTEVTVTIVTAPVPGAGKVAVEMGKQASDFLGNFNDAGQVVNRARALRSLEIMARYAEGQMKTLRPAIQEAQRTRTMLSECRRQYRAAGAQVTPKVAQSNDVWILKEVKRDNRVIRSNDYLTKRNQANFSSTLEEGRLSYINTTRGHEIDQNFTWSPPPRTVKPGMTFLTAEALLKAKPTIPSIDAGVEIYYYPQPGNPNVIGYVSDEHEPVNLSTLKPIIVRMARTSRPILKWVTLCCVDRIGSSLPRGVKSHYEAGINFPVGIPGKQVKVFLYAYAGLFAMADDQLLGWGHHSIFEYTYEWAGEQ